MAESGQEDSATSSVFRYRSPSFRSEEVKALVELIEKYKHAILNKATNSAANHAKDKAWAKLAKEFNKRGLGFNRNTDVLKTKWENLKRSAKKLTLNVMDDESDYYKDEISKTVAMICSAEIGQNDLDEHKLEDDFVDEKEDFKTWACDDEKSSVSIDDLSGNSKKHEIPIGFSANECQVLLQCVRQEKNVLFSKSSLMQRHQAWKRIANAYNKLSPQKRTTRDLNRKFHGMKNMAKKINIKGYFKDFNKKYEQLNEDINQPKIKSEPVLLDCANDMDFDSDDDKALRIPVEFNHGNNTSNLAFNNDPLSNAHNSDSGLGSISGNKDTTGGDAELFNFKMETARLERKRIEDAIEADKKEREIRTLEHSLRLRAARLEVIAAESKLPPSHHALQYTVEEKRAQQYLCSTQLDIG